MNGHVVIVDDDADRRELLDADLRRRGLLPHCCGGATEALQALESSTWDVLLTDLRMPGADGLELSREAASRQPDVPVVVMTAFGSLEAAVAALRAGVHDSVTRPVDLDLLAQERVEMEDVDGAQTALLAAAEALKRYRDLPGTHSGDADRLATDIERASGRLTTASAAGGTQRSPSMRQTAW